MVNTNDKGGYGVQFTSSFLYLFNTTISTVFLSHPMFLILYPVLCVAGKLSYFIYTFCIHLINGIQMRLVQKLKKLRLICRFNYISFTFIFCVLHSELSLPLRTELVLYLYREALEKLPFFQKKDPQFIVHIVTSLKLEYYAPVGRRDLHNRTHVESEQTSYRTGGGHFLPDWNNAILHTEPRMLEISSVWCSWLLREEYLCCSSPSSA